MSALPRFAALLFAVLPLAACGESGPQKSNPPFAVMVETTRPESYESDITLTGTVRAQVQSELSFRISGRVIERKLEPAIEEPLKLELASFVECVSKRGTPVVSGEDGLRALELAMRINSAIAERLMLR